MTREEFCVEEVRDGYPVDVKTKKIWYTELILLKEFGDFCKKYDLKYYAGYGTLLGAVRHKGFIPWDDDIDIFMLRPDYQRMLELAPGHFEFPFYFQNYHTEKDGGAIYNFSRLRDERTTCLDDSGEETCDDHPGIFIDIFPYDAVPDSVVTDRPGGRFEIGMDLWLSASNPAAVIEQLISGWEPLIGRETIIDILGLPYKERFDLYENFLADMYDDSEYVNLFTRQYWSTPVKKEWFRDTVDLQFEFLTVPAPIDYDKILTADYGDYMKPVQGGAAHTVGFVDPDRPYTDYLSPDEASRATFDAVVLVTPDSFERLCGQYPYYLKHLPVRNVYILGSAKVGELFSEKKEICAGDGDASRLHFINEDDILSFAKVHETVAHIMAPLLQGRELPRGITGWYYQQFLKLSYAYKCEDEYYLIWDGDTFPCHDISMFSAPMDGLDPVPYFDLKREEHPQYFETMAKLIPGMEKVIGPSFVSEHMLFKKAIVLDLLKRIESNESIAGTVFWEKVLNAVGCDRMQESSFSEYETYGTYVALTTPTAYKLREWHSFRLGGEFYDPQTITERDYNWLGADFDAISFEKGQTVREDHMNLFDNPAYQAKLSARQMLEAAQDAFDDGYKESWGGDQAQGANVVDGEYGADAAGGEELELSRFEPGENRLEYLTTDTWKIYADMADELLSGEGADPTGTGETGTSADPTAGRPNWNQAYLCLENAEFLCDDEETRAQLREMKEELMASGAVSVRPVCFIILSYNNVYLTEECLRSIYSNCAPGAFSVVILDNASDAETVKWLKSRADDNLILLLSDENMGFGPGCNEAFKYADPEADVFFLNNDTRMPANALFWLRMGLYASDDIGAAGALQNYSSYQLLDVTFDLPYQYMEFGAGRNIRMDDPYEYVRKLSGFALLIRRTVIDSVCGFDEIFAPGYFEDDDLCTRIGQQGYKLVLCRNSFIYHAGSQSFAENPEAEAIFERNRQRFIDKWGFDSYTEPVSASPTAIRPGASESAVVAGMSGDAVSEASSDDIQIKAVIWDLDNTFWNGILSEGEVAPLERNIRIVRELADAGVISAICSNNDFDAAREKLSSDEFGNIWELFVFPSIDWTPKGARIQSMISDMALRPENVLYIDDEASNLAEASYLLPELMTSGPEILDSLAELAELSEKNDTAHARLEHYRVLERKRSDQKVSSSNEQFLRDSEITISFIDNIADHIDRVCELISRTNQLNFTKVRSSREDVFSLLNDPGVECRLISARDKYGDYGIIGFYALDRTMGTMTEGSVLLRDGSPDDLETGSGIGRLLHFLFSCRVLGMGIEQYIYDKLGRPQIEIAGRTASVLGENEPVTWITETSVRTGSKPGTEATASIGLTGSEPIAASDGTDIVDSIGAGAAANIAPTAISVDAEYTGDKPKVLLKGPCDIDGITPYLSGVFDVELETNFVDSRDIVVAGSNNSIHLYEAYHTPVDTIRKVISDSGFLCEADFLTFMFDDPYDMVIFSTLSEGHSGIYRHRETDMRIAFGSCREDMTDPVNWDKFISGEYANHNVAFDKAWLDRFAREFAFEGNLHPDQVIRNIKWMREQLNPETILLLLLGSEIESDDNSHEFAYHAPIYRELNRRLYEEFADSDNVWLLNVTDYITGQDSFEDCINHFSREVYHAMSQDIINTIVGE
ncbi:MAG: HAD-IIIC family phosphatase [Lachnospiraceae bacterium]|nr:HAD-IIIC family phosphatase [Lachnospiraceae bacterium]